MRLCLGMRRGKEESNGRAVPAALVGSSNGGARETVVRHCGLSQHARGMLNGRWSAAKAGSLVCRGRDSRARSRCRLRGAGGWRRKVRWVSMVKMGGTTNHSATSQAPTPKIETADH
jgi:hypothetical protein